MRNAMTRTDSGDFALPKIPVSNTPDEFRIRRIFCVGRNYADHAAEMGAEVDRDAPFYFTKSPFAYCASGSEIPYPPGTSNLHHEVELVVALGASVFHCDKAQANQAIYAFGCGLDLTRRDLQQIAKDTRRPWDTGKDFENSAILGPLTLASDAGQLEGKRIELKVNGAVRQSAVLDDMVWTVEEIIMHLSTLYHLVPGDVIMTGTPAGVGPLKVDDVLEGSIDGLTDITLKILPAE